MFLYINKQYIHGVPETIRSIFCIDDLIVEHLTVSLSLYVSVADLRIEFPLFEWKVKGSLVVKEVKGSVDVEEGIVVAGEIKNVVVGEVKVVVIAGEVKDLVIVGEVRSPLVVEEIESVFLWKLDVLLDLK